MTVLAMRDFTPQDLLDFAQLSGDWNPIHVDPVAARRLLAGRQVVHGMLTLLWALDCYMKTQLAPSHITAFFQRPLMPGEKLQLVHTSLEGEGHRLSVRRDGEETVSILLRGHGAPVHALLPPEGVPRTEVLSRSFPELKHARGELPVSADLQSMTAQFPNAVQSLGALPVASIMALSRLVGMQCPGLHSLYTGLDCHLEAAQTQARLRWHVSRHTIPLAPIRMEVTGGGISAKLDAFLRPAPVAQPSMQQLAGILPPDLCRGERVVIIGGSRGLGELVAKLVASSGGEVLMTYRTGAADAQALAGEITGCGGRAEILQADMDDPAAVAASILYWGRATQLYYFPTPHIAPQKRDTFDQALYRSYRRVYGESFEALVGELAQALQGLKVFYPSTVFIDERPAHFAEYIKAKEDAEARCAALKKQFPDMNIIIRRLPRMRTDQTATVLPNALKPAMQEMQRVVRQMQSSSSDSGYAYANS